MADRAIGELERASSVDRESLFVMEQQGKPMSVTGGVLTAYVTSVGDEAIAAAESAKRDADRAEAARDSIVLDEQKIEQAVKSAETSAENAASSEAVSVDAANRAQAYAEQASTPVVSGVYNIILTDRVTGEKYALLVESGHLAILGVSDSLDATDMTLIDNTTGTSYALVVDDGRLAIEEV